MEKAKTIIPLLTFVAGAMMLLFHSSFQDIGITIISIGGLFSIWFKLGRLESETRQLGNRLEIIERQHERMLEKCTMVSTKKGKRNDAEDDDQ